VSHQDQRHQVQILRYCDQAALSDTAPMRSEYRRMAIAIAGVMIALILAYAYFHSIDRMWMGIAICASGEPLDQTASHEAESRLAVLYL